MSEFVVAPALGMLYRGRFAPTPSGALHFGSLVAALGSYLDARTQDGAWLVRMEDVDPPRVVPGAADAILRTLDAFGFEWDGPVMLQSARGEAYLEAMSVLRGKGRLYPCTCTRKQLGEAARRGIDGPVYPGICRSLGQVVGPAAQRLRVPLERVEFLDRQQGRIACDVADECGDYVLRRADGVFSYQLAVVVDDAAQGITHVVRGADLITSTPRQIVLQRALGLPTPVYMHVPVVLDGQGHKLSKQTLAAPIDGRAGLPLLQAALGFLGGKLEGEPDNLPEFWRLAQLAWGKRRVVPVRGQRMPERA